jgi:hypothetical protein
MSEIARVESIVEVPTDETNNQTSSEMIDDDDDDDIIVNDQNEKKAEDADDEELAIRSLAEELEAPKGTHMTVYYAYDIATLMTNRGFSLVRLGELRAALSNARLRALVLTECIAIVAHGELMRMLRDSTDCGPQHCVAEFLNLLLGFHDGSEAFWRDTVVIKLLQTFAKFLTDDEAASSSLVPAHMLVFQLLRSLLTHRTGLALAPVAQERITRFTPYGHDRKSDRPDPAMRASAAALRSSRSQPTSPVAKHDDDSSSSSSSSNSDGESENDHAPLGWQVDDEDVDKASATRLFSIAVHANDPQATDVNWTELILLVSDESDEARLEDLIEHGRVISAGAPPTVVVSAPAEPGSSARPSKLDDEWVMLHEKESATLVASAAPAEPEASPPPRKLSKPLSLRAGLATLRLGIMQMTNSLKK